jgi:hypothetical protein
MKSISSLAKSHVPKLLPTHDLVHFISVLGGFRELELPVLGANLCCPICGGKDYHTPLYHPSPTDDRRVWLCVNGDCGIYNRANLFKAVTTQAISRRAIEWPLFCEINELGDEFHGIKFENIEQSPAKVDYLLKFAKTPSGIVLMQGQTGTGKSFCSIATCELFTRYNSSCVFTTHRQMLFSWLEAVNSKSSEYIQKIKTCSLLVVDDFGTAEPSPQFMGFFMDLINSRMQWTKRGTIISTNRSDAELSSYCGEALTDRLWTGQKFEFHDKSKRKKKVL